MTRRTVGVLAAAWVLTACGPGSSPGAEGAAGGAGGGEEPPDPSVLMEADRAFARDVREAGAEGAADAWASWFAEDGRQLGGGGVTEGREAIREAMREPFRTVDLRWEPVEAFLGPGGRMGYTVGRYRSLLRSRPDSVLGTGHYLSVWRREADGSWKVVADGGAPASGVDGG